MPLSQTHFSFHQRSFSDPFNKVIRFQYQFQNESTKITNKKLQISVHLPGSQKITEGCFLFTSQTNTIIIHHPSHHPSSIHVYKTDSRKRKKIRISDGLPPYRNPPERDERILWRSRDSWSPIRMASRTRSNTSTWQGIRRTPFCS